MHVSLVLKPFLCLCWFCSHFQILVLNSIRKPKRIIIRGDDEWEYPFLVKGGEDLRLDQRIEQLFGIMNQILREDPACCQRGLRLRTYKVVPMTPRYTHVSSVLCWIDSVSLDCMYLHTVIVSRMFCMLFWECCMWHVCMYVRMYICMYVCMFVCTYCNSV